jgi:hypothetical protein
LISRFQLEKMSTRTAVLSPLSVLIHDLYISGKKYIQCRCSSLLIDLRVDCLLVVERIHFDDYSNDCLLFMQLSLFEAPIIPLFVVSPKQYDSSFSTYHYLHSHKSRHLLSQGMNDPATFPSAFSKSRLQTKQ